MAGLRSVQLLGRLALSLGLLISAPALLPAAQAAEEQPAAASPSTTRQKQLAEHLKTRGFLVYGDRKSTRLNSSHSQQSRMPSSA